MHMQRKTDYDFVWNDIFLITNFEQKNVEEQVREAKKLAVKKVLHIHYGCNYIGIGTFNKNGSMGCFFCYERQYDINNNLGKGIEVKDNCFSKYLKNQESMYIRQIANILGLSLIKLPEEEEAAYVIYRNSLSIEKIYIKGIENCKCCGTMQVDKACHIDFTTEEFFEDVESFRVKKSPDLKMIKKEMMLYKSGMFQYMYRYYKSPYIPIICVEFNDVISGRKIRSFGRSFHLAGVESSALLEGMERYSGMLPRRKKSSVKGTVEEVGEDAINPEKFILHDREDIEKFGIIKYEKEKPINWTWAYSWRKKSSVLIPEQIAYFDVNKNTEEKRFIYETSNGISLGGSLKEAILYGLFEVIERDAFLLSWYNLYQPKKIALGSIRDKKIRDTIQLVEADGYRIHIFDITTENRVPAVWVLIENPSKEAKVRSYTAAGAHINPYKAIESGLVEAITSMPIYESIMPAEKDRAHLLNKDYSKIIKMEDHVLMYSVLESFEQLEYLFEREEYCTVEQLYPWWKKEKKEISLTKILGQIFNRIMLYHEDIIIVDQSNDLIERYGFHCAKVIIPSMLTIHFGEQFKRINIKRVQNGAVLSGWRKEPIEEENINKVPHPFP